MVPSTVGTYRIVRKLGEGGMGEVYEGVHIEIESRVAIKVLRSDVVNRPGALRRFKNEARAVSKIKHPGLIQIFDFCRLPDGSLYMVMEHLQGVSLAARLEQRGGRLCEAEVLRLAWQLSDCLCEAHARGIVHRDIKPSNIMLVVDRAAVGGERLKLLDFGIAHLGGSELSPEERATPAGQLLGTPRYMSPEQCRGSTQIDGKADVYSLGVLLYEALAGRAPFQAPTSMDLIALHLTALPDPLRAAAPETRAAVADLIHRMLAKDAEARPSMQDVRSALYALDADEPLPSPRRLPTHKELVAQAVPAVEPPPSAPPGERTVDLQTQHAPEPPLFSTRMRRRVALAAVVLLAGVFLTIMLIRLLRGSGKDAVSQQHASGASQVVSTS